MAFEHEQQMWDTYYRLVYLSWNLSHVPAKESCGHVHINGYFSEFPVGSVECQVTEFGKKFAWKKFAFIFIWDC
jgi:hypothetical protein